MNPVTSISIPENANQQFWHSIIDAIRSEKFESSSIQFDWAMCKEIDDLCLCLFMNIMVECEWRKIRVFNAPIIQGQFYHDRVFPFVSFPVNELDPDNLKSQAFITAVNDDEKAVARVELMKRFFANHPLLRNIDTGALEVIFAELYMNVCQHSSPAEVENGIVLISIDEENSLLEMVVSDIGVGIPANIKEAFEPFADESDAVAIAYATKDFVTTKNIEQNRGRGLNTLKTSVIALKGRLDVFSGNGQFVVKDGAESLLTANCYHNGTQIKLWFDLSNFKAKSESDFSEEVTF